MTFKGLSDEQVIKSREEHGSNALSEVKGETFMKKLLANFGDPMIKILMVALAINVVILILSKTGVVDADVEWYEPLGIALAVILATFVSTFSEYRNENAFQKLQDEASKIVCKVYRNGENVVEIPIDDIVTDDLILLQFGDKIPADGIIVDGNIKVDQSVLNGESKEAAKIAVPDDYADDGAPLDTLNPYKIFKGTIVCSGNAVMKAVSVGDKTEYGKIAAELQQDDERESPLKVKLAGLAGGISKFGYMGGIAIALALMCSRIFGTGVTEYFSGSFGGVLIKDLLDAVILAVIIIVMAVPEGLPLMIAIVSAQNMGKMLKDNVLVRKIAGIETAGSLNILFSDKTGTITKGLLEVVNFTDGFGNEYKECRDIDNMLGRLAVMAISQNTTSIINGDKVIGGNATERAVLTFAKDSILNDTLNAQKITQLPFSSDNKYSATTISNGGKTITCIKGAPEKIIAKCKYFFDTDGKKLPIEDNWIIETKIDELASRAIRVLALAISDDKINDDKLPEDDWTLIGILGIRDEVRPESVTAIAEVQKAGVQVVMITGDRKDTAVAIANEAGLIDCDDAVMLTSDELAGMSDDEVTKILPKIRVISRALPSDKSRLVRLAQESGLVAGMTGDGVNDSPALKKADVGFAMGGGTEVAKEASDIVILDDNFNSIDKAILYGRTIFNSIRKFIIFQLTINVVAVTISFICPLLSMDNPLTITQILWVNLVMDTLAALAFGGEPALHRFMDEKPKSRLEPIVSKAMWGQILTGAIWAVLVSLAFLLVTPLQTMFLNNDALAFKSYDDMIYDTNTVISAPTVNHVDKAIQHMYNKGIITEIDAFESGVLASDLFKYVFTGYFALFIFIAVFNAFNARTDKLDLFDNLGKNKGFLKILGIIVVVQVGMTYLGGAVMSCYGLTATQWLVIIGLALTIIPVDIIRKLIVGSGNTAKEID